MAVDTLVSFPASNSRHSLIATMGRRLEINLIKVVISQ